MTIDEAIIGLEKEVNTEQIVEWLKKLKFINEWKDDVMDVLCKFDANSVEELYELGKRKGRADAIDDSISVFTEIAEMCGMGSTFIHRVGMILEQLKEAKE